MEAVVADDSGFIRSVLTSILEDAGVEVVGEASDGEKAVRKVVETEPDVVTMDVEMPEMDGIQAVDEIMQKRPTPVVMFSAHTQEGSDRTFEALEKGAFDFVPKPDGDSPGISSVSDEFTGKVKLAAEADARTLLKERNGDASEAGAVEEHGRAEVAAEQSLLVVGASTGGPAVVESLLKNLPSDVGLRVLVVQHMPKLFTERFARRLGRETGFDVYEASDGSRLKPGEVAVAPGHAHTGVESHSEEASNLTVDDRETIVNVKPSIDVALSTAADAAAERAIAVVLTGMGEDGKQGARRIQEQDGTVIAQSAESCAVFGIPGAVVDNGDADVVLPPGEIPGEILDHIEEGG